MAVAAVELLVAKAARAVVKVTEVAAAKVVRLTPHIARGQKGRTAGPAMVGKAAHPARLLQAGAGAADTTAVVVAGEAA
jgi:hypothetical protein